MGAFQHGGVMRKVLVTIVGRDRPGIIYKVSRALADYRFNVIEVTQTTLAGEFAGLFSCGIPEEADIGDFTAVLAKSLEGSGLAHWVNDFDALPLPNSVDLEPYVVTVRGRDRLGIIPEFSGAMAGFDVNVDNLRAISLAENGYPGGDEAGAGPPNVLMFFELSVPKAVNQGAFRQALTLIAEELDMELSLQHRNIFEAMHRL